MWFFLNYFTDIKPSSSRGASSKEHRKNLSTQKTLGDYPRVYNYYLNITFLWNDLPSLTNFK